MSFSDDDLRAILSADTCELKTLAQQVGLDPGQDFRGLDLSEINLAGQDLAGFDFSNANLCNANFTGANLTGALFDHSYLRKANFYAANLRDAIFTYCDCSGGVFVESCLDNAFFIGCVLVDMGEDFYPALFTHNCPPPTYPSAAIEALEEALQDSNRLTRGLATVALGRMDLPETTGSAFPIEISEQGIIASGGVRETASEFEAGEVAGFKAMSPSAGQVQPSARSLKEISYPTGVGGVSLPASADQAVAATEKVDCVTKPNENLTNCVAHIGDVLKMIQDIAAQTKDRSAANSEISGICSSIAELAAMRAINRDLSLIPDLSCKVAANIADADADATRPRLTPRQRDVLAMLYQGKTNKEIAQALDLAEITVKCHLNAIQRALGVKKRTEIAIMAAKIGL